MKKLSFFMAVMLILTVLVTGCGQSAPAASEEGSKAAEEKVVLKVAFFKGGFGDVWFNWLKEEFEKNHQNVTVQLEGDPNLLDTITAKIEGGVDSPDVFFTNGSKWSIWGPQNLVLDITDIYQSKVPGTEMKLDEYIQATAKDTFYYDPVKAGTKMYAVPWSAGPQGIVYNKKLFDEHGWKYPETWADFEKLCADIKAAGIAPLAYPGQFPNYIRPLYRSWQVQSLGEDKFKEYKSPSSVDIYSDEALLTPWKKWESLFKNGWIMDGTTALNHTQSQMEFINNKAAMIINGYWLENEMKDAWPKDYDIRMAPIPADGVLNKPATFLSLPDYAAIYGKTKNPEIAKEFLLFSLSPEASRKFTELCGGLRPLKYDLNGIEISEFTKSCAETISNSNYYVLSDGSTNPLMYTSISKDYINNVATKKMTAEQAFESFKKDAAKEYEKIKKDLGIK